MNCVCDPSHYFCLLWLKSESCPSRTAILPGHWQVTKLWKVHFHVQKQWWFLICLALQGSALLFLQPAEVGETLLRIWWLCWDCICKSTHSIFIKQDKREESQYMTCRSKVTGSGCPIKSEEPAGTATWSTTGLFPSSSSHWWCMALKCVMRRIQWPLGISSSSGHSMIRWV